MFVIFLKHGLLILKICHKKITLLIADLLFFPTKSGESQVQDGQAAGNSVTMNSTY